MSDPYISNGSGPLPPPPASELRRANHNPGRPLMAIALVAVLLPILEIVFLLLLGRTIGLWWTLALLVAEAALGAYLLKREGKRAWRAVVEAVTAGVSPAAEVADGALIVVGAVLFILPGLLTDIVGLLCLIPGTRGLMRKLLAKALGLQPRKVGELRRHVPTGANQTIEGEVLEGDVQDYAYRRPLER